MQKWTYFESHDHEGWPDPTELKPYFFAPAGAEWFHTGGNDTARLSAEGLYGTEKGIPGKTRTDLSFELYGVPSLGMLLF
jgi:hypothetical protein